MSEDKLKDMEGFLIELENYDFGVRKLIPPVFTSLEDADEAFSDELDGLLYARDYLEREIREGSVDEALASHLKRIKELDALLRARKEIVLKIIPNFSRWRERFKEKPPRSHWWWYLDQLDEHETRQEVLSLSIDHRDG